MIFKSIYYFIDIVWIYPFRSEYPFFKLMEDAF